MRCARTAGTIDSTFGLWILVGLRKHKFDCICQVAPMCPHGKAHWRHLVNTTNMQSADIIQPWLVNTMEPPNCGGDAVLCQITLTTCFTCSSCWSTCHKQMLSPALVLSPCELVNHTCSMVLCLLSSCLTAFLLPLMIIEKFCMNSNEICEGKHCLKEQWIRTGMVLIWVLKKWHWETVLMQCTSMVADGHHLPPWHHNDRPLGGRSKAYKT